MPEPLKTRKLPGHPSPGQPQPGDWWWYGYDDHPRAGLVVCLPNGELAAVCCWRPDGGPTWTITGDDGSITVSPSIEFNKPAGQPLHNPNAGYFHGWLQNGELRSC